MYLSFYSVLILFISFHSFSQGRTELHDAAEKGDDVAVRKLLKTSININSRTARVSSTD